MNGVEFGEFLTRGGRSNSAVARCIRYVHEFEAYLKERGSGSDAADATPQELEDFVEWIEREPKASANTQLWALGYYYEYTSNEEMRHLASHLRQQRIRRKPFPLKVFRGVSSGALARLAEVGIHYSDQMLQAGKTSTDRQALAATVGFPEEVILELVKLSDLARIRGVKGVRARLYYDAGIETVEQMARQDPEALRTMIAEFVDQTGFDGVATLPAEARFTVAEARRLPGLIEY